MFFLLLIGFAILTVFYIFLAIVSTLLGYLWESIVGLFGGIPGWSVAVILILGLIVIRLLVKWIFD